MGPSTMGGDVAAVAPLPQPSAGFRTEFRAELVRLFRPPRAELTSLLGNAVLVTVLWTGLPTAVRDRLFTLTGSMAFAVVLQAWMLGDTSTTNVFGNNAAPALDVLRDPTRLRHWLRAKAAALAVVVAIPCAVVAIVLAATEHAFEQGLLLCLVVITAPFGAAAVAAWLGILWPYHPRPLRWRWERRHARRSTVRWLILVVAPFLVVPLIMAVFLAIGIAAGDAVGGRDANGHFDMTAIAVAAVVAAVLSLTAFAAAPYLSSALGRRRLGRLSQRLMDPESG